MEFQKRGTEAMTEYQKNPSIPGGKCGSVGGATSVAEVSAWHVTGMSLIQCSGTTLFTVVRMM